MGWERVLNLGRGRTSPKDEGYLIFADTPLANTEKSRPVSIGA
jgi:hypothetical protein